MAVPVNAMGAEVIAAAEPVVVTAAGAPVPVACRRNWSEAASRPEAVKAFCRLIVGALPVFVKMQLICAAGTTLAAGTVSTLPARVPKLAGFPVTAALASLHVAEVVLKLMV